MTIFNNFVKLHKLAKFYYQTVFASQIIPLKYVLWFMFGYLIMSWHLNIWKVKIWLSQEWEKLSKWNKKKISLFHKCPHSDLQNKLPKCNTNFKYVARWDLNSQIWIFNHHAIDAEVWSRPMCKYGLGVSHFKGTPQLILLICKFDKWSKNFH